MKVSRHDPKLRAIVEVIRQVALPPTPARRPIDLTRTKSQ
jgi:hypothetical protein